MILPDLFIQNLHFLDDTAGMATPWQDRLQTPGGLWIASISNKEEGVPNSQTNNYITII